MARKDWYTVKNHSAAEGGGWKVLKFDEDFKQTETYLVDLNIVACTCMAGYRGTCRHREIVKLFRANDLVGSHRMYNFDKAKWFEPPKDQTEG